MIDGHFTDETAYKPASGGTWVIMFADLLSLLLTFFVMLFSMNGVQGQSWQAVVDSMSGSLNSKKTAQAEKQWSDSDNFGISKPLELKLGYLRTVIDQKLADDPIMKHSQIQLLDDRLVISIPSDMLFERGSGGFSNAAAPRVLQELGNILRTVKNDVGVVGHVDAPAIGGGDLAPSWQLSLVRAIAVSRVLRDSGYSYRIATYGNGDAGLGEPGMDMPNGDEAKLARRVDIIVREADTEGWSE